MREIPFAVIFDMDGTLFQTETVLVPALHKTFDRLRREGLWQGDTPVEEYLRILGVPIAEVWRQLMPEASEAVRKQADAWFLEDIIREIEQGNGRLYPEVLTTLANLSNREFRFLSQATGANAISPRFGPPFCSSAILSIFTVSIGFSCRQNPR